MLELLKEGYMDINIKNEKLRHFAEAYPQTANNRPQADIMRSQLFIFLVSILFWSSLLFIISQMLLPSS